MRLDADTWLKCGVEYVTGSKVVTTGGQQVGFHSNTLSSVIPTFSDRDLRHALFRPLDLRRSNGNVLIPNLNI